MARLGRNLRIEMRRDGWVISRPYRSVYVDNMTLLFIEALLINTLVHICGHLGFLRWLAYSLAIYGVWRLFALATRRKSDPPPPRSRPNMDPPGAPPARDGCPVAPVGPRVRVAAERKAIPVPE